MARHNHAKHQHPHKPAAQSAETHKPAPVAAAQTDSVPAQPDSATDRPEATSAERSPPTHEEISQRAYELYVERGGDHGRHEEDWLQAERELGTDH